MRRDDKQLLPSSLGDEPHLLPLDSRAVNDVKEVPHELARDERVADEYTNLSSEDTAFDGVRRQATEYSCIKKLVKRLISCNDGEREITLADYRESSLNACHSPSVEKYGIKKCEPIKTFFPGCKGLYTTSCGCAE